MTGMGRRNHHGDKMIVWVDYAENRYILEELIAEARIMAQDIVDEQKWPENEEYHDLLDFACHIFKCGCDTQDAWHALHELYPQKARDILMGLVNN